MMRSRFYGQCRAVSFRPKVFSQAALAHRARFRPNARVFRNLLKTKITLDNENVYDW